MLQFCCEIHNPCPNVLVLLYSKEGEIIPGRHLYGKFRKWNISATIGFTVMKLHTLVADNNTNQWLKGYFQGDEFHMSEGNLESYNQSAATHKPDQPIKSSGQKL
ncbi:uncharacterized protein LOC128551633 [Mercenaria mercenaria]|uniref:uncharacterized protein LOC128551633 n=1 Tax=Mercenaria mercenaria TaxID=6596 RepID=UPI00234FAA1A|nr:uncharacterized protein LOC128551633 [Mercenaria mercenaria]